MNGTGKSQDGWHSDRVRQLIDSKHLSRRLRAVLEPSDIREIREAALGNVPNLSIGGRVSSVSLIAAAGGEDEANLLGQLLADDKQDERIRIAAAVGLSEIERGDAEGLLIANLEIPQAHLREKVIKSLGRIGGKRSFEALSGLKGEIPDFVRKQLQFSKALIAYRHDLDEDPLEFIKGVYREPGPKDELLEVRLSLSDRPVLQETQRNLDGSAYGMTFSETLGVHWTIGREKLMLLFNDKAATQAGLVPVFDTRMLMGVVARWLAETETYCTQYVLFSKPAGKGAANLLAVRSDGEAVFSGELKATRTGVAFELADVERAGTAPIRLSGTLTADGIDLSTSVVFARRQGKREVEPIQ